MYFIKFYIFLTNPSTKPPSILKRYDCLVQYLDLLLQTSTIPLWLYKTSAEQIY